MSIPVRIERFLRSMRDGLLGCLLAFRTIRKAAYRHLSLSGNLIFRRFDDHDLVFDPGDLVGRTILEKGDFDRARTNAICHRALTLTDRRTVLEIGANIGTQTVYFIRSGGFETVVCLEPDPKKLSLLELNIRINQLNDIVTVIPSAAGSSAGTLTLRRDAGNSGGGTVRAEKLPGGRQSEVAVSVVTIDELVDSGVIDPQAIGLVWMDAEGFEDEIFSACKRLLSMRVPITFEFTPGFYSSDKQERIVETIYKAYESVSIVDEVEFRPLARIDALGLARRVDLFCC